jgi:hypothetical protein
MSDAFRRHCRALRLATQVVFYGLALLVLTGAAGLPFFPNGAKLPEDFPTRLALFGVQALPAFGYLWALWSVQRALGDLGAGRIFHPTVARALRHVGFGVLVGSLLKVFAVTNLTRLFVDVRGNYAWFDLSAVVLGVVGAALVLLASVIDQARDVQAELDEIL